MKKSFIFVMFLFVSSLFAEIKEQTINIISEEFPESYTTFEKYSIPMSIKNSIEKQTGQKFLKNFIYLWRIKKDEKTIAYAIADGLRAKSAFITTCILINSNRKIERLDILNYNGHRGRQVTNVTWLEQFNGKSAESDFTIGNSIDAISGATRSADAIAKGVSRWCLLINHIIEKEIN